MLSQISGPNYVVALRVLFFSLFVNLDKWRMCFRQVNYVSTVLIFSLSDLHVKVSTFLIYFVTSLLKTKKIHKRYSKKQIIIPVKAHFCVNLYVFLRFNNLNSPH